jgi:L-arabinose isomerase
MTPDHVRQRRVAILAPYTDFWEPVAPYSLRESLAAVLDDASAHLGVSFDVVEAAIVGSREDGAAAGRRIVAWGVDAVLVLQAMAVMPAFTLAALELLPDLPIVIWAARRTRRLTPAFDHVEVTRDGATVGTPMLTNPLIRSGRPFELVTGLVDDPAALGRVAAALGGAVAATRLSKARIGQVGTPIDGYACVTIDAESLRRSIGARIVQISPTEVLERYRAVDDAQLAAMERETRALYDVSGELDADSLTRTLRAACALADVCTEHRLDAGAMNCHVPEIRFGEEIGVAPCFGLGRMTSLGIPWSCAGDVPVAVAMLALKTLGGAANYHELEALDSETGELMVANTGEHDLDFGTDARPTLVASSWFNGDPHCGACACLTPRAGSATLLGFVELDAPERSYRFVAAAGAFTDSRFPGVHTPTAAFRFSHGPAEEAWMRWCRSGVSHHSAATPGDLVSSIATMGRLLGTEVVSV